MCPTGKVLRNSGSPATVRGVRVTAPWYGGKRQATVAASTRRRQNARYASMSLATRYALMGRRSA